jgi:hypothetical protein
MKAPAMGLGFFGSGAGRAAIILPFATPSLLISHRNYFQVNLPGRLRVKCDDRYPPVMFKPL